MSVRDAFMIRHAPRTEQSAQRSAAAMITRSECSCPPTEPSQKHPAPAAEQSRPFQPRGRRRSGHHKNVGRRNTEAAGVKQTNRQRETVSSKPSPPPLICPGELIRCNPTIRNKRDFHGFNRFRRQNPVRFQAAATIRWTNIFPRTIPL